MTERNSVCDQCPKVYKNNLHLNDHVKRKHSGDRFDHPCTSCPKRFKVKRVLQKHMEVHIPQPHKKYECKICLKVLPNIRSLGIHQQNSHNEDIFKCEICPQMLNKSSMKRHIAIHKLKISHFCWLCNKGFKTNGALDKHQATHVDVKRNILCNVCNKGCRTETELRKHKQIHTSEKPYSCAITTCGKTYNNHGSLSHHKRKHKQEPKSLLETSNVTNAKQN